jgi:hypothetical protein
MEEEKKMKSNKNIIWRVVFWCQIIIYLFLPISSWAACTGTSPSWSSSADYNSVSTCVASALAGDVIRVSGNATWTSTLPLTRGVKLVGNGNTTITGQLTFIYWTPDASAQSAHDTLFINGFTFDANDSSIGNAGVIRVNNTSATNYVNLVVKNNTFKNVSPSGRGLYIRGMVYGAVASNIFDRIAIPLGIYGNDYNSWENQTQAYGVEQNLYFEDNAIQFSTPYVYPGYEGWMEAGQGGRVVVRYNTWDYTNVPTSTEFWDLHGLQSPPGGTGTAGCANYSTMVAEYYGNKIVNQVGAYRWMAQRGGWLLQFYNTLSGTTNPYNGVTQYYCNSCQATGSFNQKVENTYYWKNLANGTEKPATVYDPGAAYGCESDPIVENSDFFNYNVNFNGTSGIGCGTLSARPATCTTGVGYWATNQSCSNLTGMVGKKPMSPISGTLYKCTAPNTWTAYYTPYTYPHPLRKPAPPTWK